MPVWIISLKQNALVNKMKQDCWLIGLKQKLLRYIADCSMHNMRKSLPMESLSGGFDLYLAVDLKSQSFQQVQLFIRFFIYHLYRFNLSRIESYIYRKSICIIFRLFLKWSFVKVFFYKLHWVRVTTTRLRVASNSLRGWQIIFAPARARASIF